jgi:hypothetical protein
MAILRQDNIAFEYIIDENSPPLCVKSHISDRCEGDNRCGIGYNDHLEALRIVKYLIHLILGVGYL